MNRLFNRSAAKRLLVLTLTAAAALAGAGAAPATAPPAPGRAEHVPAVRVSAWYWLNAAPRDQWEGDFATMKRLGFTDVLLCWGADISAVRTRKADTRQAMRWAHEAGIGVYLLIWHPWANTLPREPEYMQISPDGVQYDSFDVFNPTWRATRWKAYLEDVVGTYRDEPGLMGYAFDDSFGGGGAQYSYGPYERQAFGAPLPRKPGDPGWDKWMEVRQGWWEDWARETVAYMRAADPDTRHVIYLEDSITNVADPKRAQAHGLDFARVAKYFDAVGGYTAPAWTAAPDSDAKVERATADAINRVRAIIGPDKRMIYTFWCANAAEERKPGPAVYPTARQIQQVCEAALRLGIRHVDMYGYRIGDSHVKKEDRGKVVPPEPAPYELTGQFPHKFLWDRPEVHDELGKYLRGLNDKE